MSMLVCPLILTWPLDPHLSVAPIVPAPPCLVAWLNSYGSSNTPAIVRPLSHPPRTVFWVVPSGHLGHRHRPRLWGSSRRLNLLIVSWLNLLSLRSRFCTRLLYPLYFPTLMFRARLDTLFRLKGDTVGADGGSVLVAPGEGTSDLNFS